MLTLVLKAQCYIGDGSNSADSYPSNNFHATNSTLVNETTITPCSPSIQTWAIHHCKLRITKKRTKYIFLVGMLKLLPIFFHIELIWTVLSIWHDRIKKHIQTFSSLVRIEICTKHSFWMFKSRKIMRCQISKVKFI